SGQQTRECQNPKCKRRTSKVSLYCGYDHKLSFQPRLFFTVLLILSPALLCLALSLWASVITVYVALTSGIILYIFVSFRDFRTVRRAILLWLLPLSIAVGICVASPDYKRVLLNYGTWAYIAVFFFLVLRHIQNGLERGDHPWEVTIAAVSLSLSLYSLIFEVVKWLYGKGVGPESLF